MNPKIAPHFQKFKQTHFDLYNTLFNLPAKQLNQQPGEGKWSVVQIINHLANSEEASIVYVKKKIQYTKNYKKSGIKSLMRYFTLRLAFLLPIKYKIPPILKEPSNEIDFETAWNNWLIVRNEWESIVKEMNENQLKSDIFKHPVLGKINIIQAQKFMQTHFDRHKEQIERLIKEA